MKTMELLNEFKQGRRSPSDESWQQVLWNAANLVRLAEIERRTHRERCEDEEKEDPRQMRLFEE